MTEIRFERAIYLRYQRRPAPLGWICWLLVRFGGSVFQWIFFSCEISGMVDIGRGLRLPHPQNIIVGMKTRVGDYCSIYHNVTVARSTFQPGVQMPAIGDRVVLGTGAIVIGGIEIGDDAIVGAGAVVTRSVPPAMLATSPANVLKPRNAIAGARTVRFANPHPLVADREVSDLP